MDYNHYRTHSSLSYMTPAEFAKLCIDVGCVRPQRPRSEEGELCEILSQKGGLKNSGSAQVTGQVVWVLIRF